MYSQQR